MLIISVGIKKVIINRRYHAGQDTRELFNKAGIKLKVMEDRVQEYEDQ